MKFEVRTKGKGFKGLVDKISKMSKSQSYVKAGLLSSKKASRPDGEMTNAELGVIHEFGTSKIPARPFVGPSFNNKKDFYKKMLMTLAKRVVTAGILFDEKFTLEKALGILGQKMSADMKAFVVGGAPLKPDNSPAVKARKEKLSSGAAGSVRPLVDTGRMVNSLTYAVVRKDEQ